MPRRSSTRISSSVAFESQAARLRGEVDSVSENLRRLRQHWKWAAFCQFFHVFFDLVAITDISIEDIEGDLSHNTDVFLPRVMQRLLFTLSYDRKISPANWQNALRRQYDRRNPEANPLGSHSSVHTATSSRFSSLLKDETEAIKNEDQEHQDQAPTDHQETQDVNASREVVEQNGGKAEDRSTGTSDRKATIDWSELSMDQKLESLHTLTEWQFQNPTRLRHIMKSDDEDATWRSEPVGYDREHNAYWLIGGNRLWIQHAPPKPPTRKRKRKAAAEVETKARNGSKPGPSKRQRTAQFRSTREQATEVSTSTLGRSRAAKEQAKIKLDAQAKALAEFNREAEGPSITAARSTRSREKKSANTQASSSLKSSGVRISARLRGRQDDGWQPVPDEWLKPDKAISRNMKTGLELDDESISDLTELSDDESLDIPKDEEVEPPDVKAEEDEAIDHDDVANPTTFLEWETICITLSEWEHFADRFATSTHYTEKAFYKFLTGVIVPQVVADLRAVEQKRRLEEALNHRKRSSRIATRENEREAIRLAAQRKAEEQEKYSRTRRLEARLQREETERVKRERAREERRMKREIRTAEDEDDQDASSPKEERQEYSSPRSDPEATRSKRQSSRHQPKKVPNNPGSDDWELDCEVCGRMGKNLDDGTPMMSCGLCAKWQHIQCHDKRDRALGRQKRDWDRIEFFCQRCLTLGTNGMQHSNGVSQPPPIPQRTMAYPSWQAQASSHIPKPLQGFSPQEPTSYSHYPAPTSSLRSSYPSQPAYTNNFSASNISFSHYQPQERAFTSEVDRTQVPQNSYYRVNGSWVGDPARYQAYPQPPTWNSNVASTTSYQPAPGPAADRQHHGYENNVQRSVYGNLASREPYRQVPSTVPRVSYHRTPYQPHP